MAKLCTPFLKLLRRVVGLASGRVHRVLGEPGRPAPSMARRARRSRGCRAASGRRRRSTREIPRAAPHHLSFPGRPHGGCVRGEYAGPELRCCALRAAIAELRAGWVHGMGPGGRGACALRPRCGCPARRAAGVLGACRGPPRPGFGSGSSAGAPEHRAEEMLRAAGRCRVHPSRPASRCWRLRAPLPGKGPSFWVRVRQHFTWGNSSADLSSMPEEGPSSFGQARSTFMGFEGLETHLLYVGRAPGPSRVCGSLSLR